MIDHPEILARMTAVELELFSSMGGELPPELLRQKAAGELADPEWRKVPHWSAVIGMRPPLVGPRPTRPLGRHVRPPVRDEARPVESVPSHQPGRRYPSLHAAAAALHVLMGHLLHACQSGEKCRGRQWRFAEADRRVA